MMIQISPACHSTFVTCGDADLAAQLADGADQAAADAWQAVECATRRALQLEAEAVRLRTIATRTRLQIGFRRPS
jgi:hypothetical protein